MDITALSKVATSLLLLIFLLLTAAWLVRRLGGTAPAKRHQAITIISAKRLGPRHSIALIDVADAQLLVGLGPGGLTLLHTLHQPQFTQSKKTFPPDLQNHKHAHCTNCPPPQNIPANP